MPYNINVLSCLSLESQSFEAVGPNSSNEFCDTRHSSRREAGVCEKMLRTGNRVNIGDDLVCGTIGDVKTVMVYQTTAS